MPKEKREKLVNAIKDEFARVSFDEVSINKIVHGAEIPRGSFYQYFLGKNDMLEFILFDYQNQMIKQMKISLHSSNGDIFKMFSDMLNFTIDFVTKEKSNSFCKNLFADIKVNTNFYLRKPKDSAHRKLIEQLKSSINLEILDLREENDFINMIEILLSTYREATAEVFLNISEHEKTKQKYFNKLTLLKRNFTKNKESMYYA